MRRAESLCLCVSLIIQACVLVYLNTRTNACIIYIVPFPFSLFFLFIFSPSFSPSSIFPFDLSFHPNIHIFSLCIHWILPLNSRTFIHNIRLLRLNRIWNLHLHTFHLCWLNMNSYWKLHTGSFSTICIHHFSAFISLFSTILFICFLCQNKSSY